MTARLVSLTSLSLRALGFSASIAICTSFVARAEEPADFTNLSLEELMDVEVTSVSKRSQRLADAAAAIFVITQEDIRRSGATSIPELLRMAPGVDVARIDANKWAVSIRGFNGRFASKLLVMIDGRSVYNPLFSGVFWDVQDVVLEDVERIEVIRGPGATLWGANAVNGVINIITKEAKDTQGVLVSGGGGTEQRAFATARYGGQVGDNLYYRAFAKGFKIDDGALASGDRGADGTDQGRTGFRLDWNLTSDDALTLSGDIFKQNNGSTAVSFPRLTPPYSATFDDTGRSNGGNVFARWSRELSETSQAALQVAYDRLDKREQGQAFTTDVVDLDVQHHFQVAGRHRVGWGIGYRHAYTVLQSSSFTGGGGGSRRKDSLFSAFVQDEVALIENRLRFTIGSKFEHNDSTGFEFQPSARILWTPSPSQSFWGAVSRAVRLPSVSEEDAHLSAGVIPPFTPDNPGPLPVELEVIGKSDLNAEKLVAFEVGYRTTPAAGLSFDVAAFYNLYDELRGRVAGTPAFAPTPVPRLVIPLTSADDKSGEA